MEIEKRKAREENLVEMGRAGIIPEDARKLQAICRSLHRQDEIACNQGQDEGEEAYEERLEKKAAEIARQYHLTTYHQTDPRGWSLYLINAKIRREAKKAGYTIDQVYSRGLGVCIW